MALFFTSLCWCCSVHTNKLTNKITQYSVEEFELLLQLDILKRIYDALHKIQDVFSVQVFFIILANVFMCSSVIGGILIKNFGEFDEFIQLDYMYYLFNSISCVVITLWIVGLIPIEMKKFQQRFYEKTYEKLLLRCFTVEEFHLKIDFCYEPDFVMTGCDILPLRRSTILALIGTLFSYTVLLVDTNMPGKANNLNHSDIEVTA
ncbi:uncharacterized protein TNIN_258551 [Trichonephila inaurata madagascariensis]|uniref:Gustatory receptor n=1 Tax=Trichonephila inaurata madagascariensis TaxID=2747483 RepID=A0A8X6WWF3_9ARAC|nr:uncharacterized protein TNIN_258551 [Trichonephila inaurata madagascariensis]